MGSFTSRQNATKAVAPKPVEVLPATESWSTLDAFQATVKKNEHHELINRSKTQKSLRRTSSFKGQMFKRTVTLNSIRTNPALPSDKQKSIAKKRVQTHAKTQVDLFEPNIGGDDETDAVAALPSMENQSRLNARRGTHFYQVRKAMVNRQQLQKLDSLALEERIKNSQTLLENPANERVQSSANLSEKPANKRVQSSTDLHEKLTDKVKVSNDTSSEPKPRSNPKPVSHSTASSVELESKVRDVQKNDEASTANATLAEPSTAPFKIDPTPHATFAQDPQANEKELECRATVAKLAPTSSDACARIEMEKLLRQWKDFGFLSRIESHALGIPPSQTTVAQLAESLVNSDANYIKTVKDSALQLQVAKAYCIYVWIANNISYDVDRWKEGENGSASNTDAEEVLECRKTVCAGYSNLFKALGHISGLEVGLIHGHVKAWKSLSEEKPDADKPFTPRKRSFHVWNSVSSCAK